MNEDELQVQSRGHQWQFSLKALTAFVVVCAVLIAIGKFALRQRHAGPLDMSKVSAVPFNQANWQRDKSVRPGMAKDIVANGTLAGMTRKQVRSLLGIGDIAVIAGDDSESYELHDNVITAPSGELGIGEARLHVWYDAGDIVREVRIELHGYIL
jgi:hypothetical protein